MDFVTLTDHNRIEAAWKSPTCPACSSARKSPPISPPTAARSTCSSGTSPKRSTGEISTLRENIFDLQAYLAARRSAARRRASALQLRPKTDARPCRAADPALQVFRRAQRPARSTCSTQVVQHLLASLTPEKIDGHGRNATASRRRTPSRGRKSSPPAATTTAGCSRARRTRRRPAAPPVTPAEAVGFFAHCVPARSRCAGRRHAAGALAQPVQDGVRVRQGQVPQDAQRARRRR